VKSKNKIRGLTVVEVMIAMVIATILLLVLGRSIRANLSFLSRLNKKKTAKAIWLLHERLRRDLENCVELTIDKDNANFFLLRVPVFRSVPRENHADQGLEGERSDEVPTHLFAFQKVFYAIMEKRVVRVAWRVELEKSESRELFGTDVLERDQSTVWKNADMEMGLDFNTEAFETQEGQGEAERKKNKPSHLTAEIAYKKGQTDPVRLLIHCRNIKAMPEKKILEKPNAVYQ